MRIYVSGPYTGHEGQNVRRAIDAGEQLLAMGHAPYIPHLNLMWELAYPNHTYEDWLALDMAWVSVCDALVRLPGPSEGADREVALARKIGIPVWTLEEGTCGWVLNPY